MGDSRDTRKRKSPPVIKQGEAVDKPLEKKRNTLIDLRTSHEKMVTNAIDGHATPIKMGIMIDRDAMSDLTESHQKRVEVMVGQSFATMPTFRPAASFKANQNGSPFVVYTPNKSMLTLSSKNGLFYIFSNHLNAEAKSLSIKHLNSDEEFFNTPEYLAIKKPKDSSKFQEIIVTPELWQTKKKRTSQGKEMVNPGVPQKKGSATQYARASNLFNKKIFWEWLHLVAHNFAGKQGQHAENLVAGTKHANTDMMFIESLVRHFSAEYPGGVILEVQANLVAETQLAKDITYKVETKDFTLSFVFNAQSELKPHVLYQEYINSFGKALIDAKSKTPGNAEQYASKKGLTTLFFSKTDHLQKQEPAPQDQSSEHLDSILRSYFK